MADDKELIRKDLAIILKLDSQIDYSKKDTVEKYYRDITQKELLKTPHGKRYLNRLENIINGNTVHTKCMFCNSQTLGNTMICAACMEKLRKPSAVYCRSCGNKMNSGDITCPACGKDKNEGYKFCAHCGKEVPLPGMEILTNNVKNKSIEFAEQAAKITKENVQSMAKKGTKLAENLTANTTTAKSRKEKGQKSQNIVICIILLLIAAAVAETIGLGEIFAFFAFAALVVLTYKTIKKKPKRNAAIAFVVFLLLSAMTDELGGAKGVPDSIINYIGTKESVVYRTYDKNDFNVDGLFNNLKENEEKNNSGFPHIEIIDGKVYGVIIESGMKSSFHAGGLCIGDTINEMVTCMKKIKAVRNDEACFIQESNGYLTGAFQYSLRDNKNNITIDIDTRNSIVERIEVYGEKK